MGPGRNYVGCNEVLAILAAGLPDPRAQVEITELSSVCLGALGQRLMALRYFLHNGATWLRYFS